MLPRLASGVALATMAALVLVGCTPPAPTEDLKAEARIGWEAYLDKLIEFGADPTSASREGLLDVASPEVADEQMVGFEAAAEAGIHAEGVRQTTAFNATVTQTDTPTVEAMVCVDATAERILAADGTDVSDSDRLFSFAVELQRSGEGDTFIVTSHTVFDGPKESDPCAQ